MGVERGLWGPREGLGMVAVLGCVFCGGEGLLGGIPSFSVPQTPANIILKNQRQAAKGGLDTFSLSKRS